MIAKHWKQILFCMAVFAVSFIFHLIAGDFFPKTAGILPDEYSFVQQASAIANGLPFSEMGNRASKFLYPLLLSPAFILFDNLEGQLAAVNFINSLLAASSVFPAFLLSHRILSNTRGKNFSYAFGFLAAFMPSTFYSVGIMAEPAAIAVGLWWLYAAYRILEIEDVGKRLYSVIGFAICTYLLYALKEYYAVYFIAFAILLIVIVDRTLKADTSITDDAKKNLIYTPIAFIATFVVCYVISQLVFFGSLFGNSYLRQLEGNSMLEHIQWLPLYIPVIVVHIIAAAGFIPLLTPLWKESRNYSRTDASFGLFVFSALIVMLLVVFLTVVLREETVYATRMILRYYDLLLFVSAVMFVKKAISYNADEIKQALSNKRVLAVAISTIILCLAFLGIVQYDGEGTSLLWLITLFNKGEMPIDGGVIDFVWIAGVKIAIVAILAALFIAARKGKLSGFKISAVLCACLCVTYLISSAIMATILRTSHEISIDEMEAGNEIVEQIEGIVGDDTIATMVIFGSTPTNYSRFYDFSAETRYIALKLRADSSPAYILQFGEEHDLGKDPDANTYLVVLDKQFTGEPENYGIDKDCTVADTKDASLYIYAAY